MSENIRTECPVLMVRGLEQLWRDQWVGDETYLVEPRGLVR